MKKWAEFTARDWAEKYYTLNQVEVQMQDFPRPEYRSEEIWAKM
jgi:hypothetical protein